MRLDRRLALGATGLVVVLCASAHATVAADCTGVTPVSNTSLKSVVVATGLNRPLFVTAPPGDVNRLFIVEQDGRILIKKRGDPPGVVSVFLDISSTVQAGYDETGLLGLAFDPDYATSGFIYVNYTAGAILGPWSTVVARYSVSVDDPDAADPGSEARLLQFAQPMTNHNGGWVQFGLDGYLYISSGDGGGAGDRHGTCGNGQNRATLLGKILRIDVRGIAPIPLAPDCGGAGADYWIPSDNPFAQGAGGDCDEIWHYGLRNPWRPTIDRLTGNLYIADVGQNCWEEINLAPRVVGGGQNFGWRQMEGNHCYNHNQPFNCNPPGQTCSGSPPCNDPSLTDPVLEYPHTDGACSITGGQVYRGCLMPNFHGTYFYGDYCAGFVKSYPFGDNWTLLLDPAGTLANSLTSFGEDAQGEVYITDRDGTVLKIMPPFTLLEVAARQTTSPFLIGPGGAWTWEDLEFATMHPVSSYRVYRGLPGGEFRCIFTTAVPEWLTGDPDVPAAGSLFAYVVTAVSPDGEETPSGNPPQSLLPDPCP